MEAYSAGGIFTRRKGGGNIVFDVFDFDDTIYDGDSTVDFWLFCLRHRPQIIFSIPIQLAGFALFALKRIDKTRFKEYFFSFLRLIGDSDRLIDTFWEKNAGKIQSWYISRPSHCHDVIISASPWFLLAPVARQYQIKQLIASNVCKETGRFDGPNCLGEEKVRRLEAELPGFVIREFYSDSERDLPLARLAQSPYYVRKGKISRWEIGNSD